MRRSGKCLSEQEKKTSLAITVCFARITFLWVLYALALRGFGNPENMAFVWNVHKDWKGSDVNLRL